MLLMKWICTRLCLMGCSLNIISRQTRMAARAPMLSLSVCPSCISSQFSPQKPSGQMHRYRSRGSKLMHVAPFRHGKSKHSLRSMQSLPSCVGTRPSPQLFQFIQLLRTNSISSNAFFNNTTIKKYRILFHIQLLCLWM